MHICFRWASPVPHVWSTAQDIHKSNLIWECRWITSKSSSSLWKWSTTKFHGEASSTMNPTICFWSWRAVPWLLPGQRPVFCLWKYSFKDPLEENLKSCCLTLEEAHCYSRVLCRRTAGKGGRQHRACAFVTVSLPLAMGRSFKVVAVAFSFSHHTAMTEGQGLLTKPPLAPEEFCVKKWGGVACRKRSPEPHSAVCMSGKLPLCSKYPETEPGKASYPGIRWAGRQCRLSVGFGHLSEAKFIVSSFILNTPWFILSCLVNKPRSPQMSTILN